MSQQTAFSENFRGAYLVPGLPHLLRPELCDSYKQLNSAMQSLDQRLEAQGVERIIYYSTQWISVLGHLFQGKTQLQGHHVDENWYELCDLPFDFRVDTPLAQRLAEAASAAGYQTKCVDYEGFPVDSGTIVADTLINKRHLPVTMVSCCVYSDYDDTAKLAKSVQSVIEAGNKPTAVVVVSGLSGRYFTTDIDWREDHVRDPQDDTGNRQMLDLLAAGKHKNARARTSDYARDCRVDMGFKGYGWLEGLGATSEGRKANVLAYGPIYGTGGAVIEF